MGKRNKYRPVGRIPNLDNPDTCQDWIDRHEPRTSLDVHQWEIWYARLGRHPYSSVQEGERPVVVLSNDRNNQYANTVTVVPFTSKMKKLEMPTHVVIGSASGWDGGMESVALVEQVTTIDKRRLLHRVGAVTNPETIEALKKAAMAQLGIREDDDEAG